MDNIINSVNQMFQSIITLGAPPMMFIILTVLALIMKVKFSRAIEGGIRLAIALTGMSAIISILTGSFGPALQAFVKSTGIQLSVTDVGWAPLSTITWGSLYTLYFAFVCIIVNAVMLAFKKTETLNVDIFNLWHLSVVGLLVMHYGNNNIFLATILVILIYVFMLINSDVMKPTMNDVLNYSDTNVTTSAHINLLITPFIMIFDKIIDKLFPFIDKYDFDAETLNKKIGFWGSKFAIGCFLGIFVGLLGRQSGKAIFTLAFTGGVCLELFGFIGGWFSTAIEPLSEGIVTYMNKKFNGRKLNVGIDWPFIATRAEVWAVANILAPILLVIALILPGNKVLPLGGILLTGLTPALLIVTRGKVMRMVTIGTLLIPTFLWTGTFISDYVTIASKAIGQIPAGMPEGAAFTAIEGGPIEKIIALVVGHFGGNMNITNALAVVAIVVVYVLIFVWYVKQMKKRNAEYSVIRKNSEDILECAAE